MTKKLSMGLAAVACVAFLASGAMGASVFFSTVGAVGRGVAPCCLNTGPGHTETLYIWSTDDQDYDTRIGMNVVSSDPVAVALVAADIANPDITSEAFGVTLDVRWHDVAVGDVTPGLISNMNGVALGTGFLFRVSWSSEFICPPFGWTDLPIPPPDWDAENRWTRTSCDDLAKKAQRSNEHWA